MSLYKFLFFVNIIFYCSPLYSKTYDKIHASYGGVTNITFGRIAGPRDGGGRISGYSWLSTYHKLNDKYYFSGNAGISLENSNSTNVIVNDANIGFHTPYSQFFIGRALNAAGRLHHDFSDFGAPGGGSDNNPVSFFFNGNYTTNVAQQLAQPFTNRVALYVKPYKKYFALGASYAPNIKDNHVENYNFFAKFRVRDEFSIAFNSEVQIKQFFLGLTGGYTQAYRPFNRFSSTGLIEARQFSFHATEKLKKENYYNRFEFNSGCLEEPESKDCRIGFQISKIKNQYIRNYGALYRYDKNDYNPSITSDYFSGWSWKLEPNLTVGFETIYRVIEEREQKITDFHWLTGVQYQF